MSKIFRQERLKNLIEMQTMFEEIKTHPDVSIEDRIKNVEIVLLILLNHTITSTKYDDLLPIVKDKD